METGADSGGRAVDNHAARLKQFIRKRFLSLQSFLGFGVAVVAQVVSFGRLILTFPRLVAVISNRANALVRHIGPLTLALQMRREV